MKNQIVAFELPGRLQRKLDQIAEIGIYSSRDEFIVEAIKAFLADQRDLRIELACEMYEKERATLGGACEIADLDIETMKQALAECGIRRTSDATVEQVKRMAERSVKFSGRG